MAGRGLFVLFWIFLAFSPYAAAANANLPEYRITLSAPAAADDESARQWRDEWCVFTHNTITLALSRKVRSECLAPDSEATLTSASIEVRIDSLEDGAIRLGIANLKRQGDWDFGRLRYRFNTTDVEVQRTNVQRRLMDFLEDRKAIGFDSDSLPITRERLFREVALTVGSQESSVIRVDESGRYRDRQSGEALSFEEAMRRYSGEGPRQLHFIRASVELGSFLGAGAILYWVLSEQMRADWEYEFTPESLRLKLIKGEGYRFDNNHMAYNTPGHPFAGAFYHLFARSNGFSKLEAFLFSVAGSGLWEVIVEFREVVGINDMIFTPLAGFAVGESMYQLGQFFAASKGSLAHRILAAVFNGPGALHRWIDGNRPKPAENLDRYGFPADVWHQFDIRTGLVATHSGSAGGTRVDARAEAEAQLYLVEGFGVGGSISRLYMDPIYTEMLLRASGGHEGLLDLLFYTKIVFAGYARQELDRDAHGNLQGYSFLIGPSSAYEHDAYWDDEFVDQLGIANILGTSAELIYYRNGLRVRVTFDVFGDFAAVRSFALDDSFPHERLVGTKSVLKDWGYYYAFGVSIDSRLEVSYKRFEAGVSAGWDSFSSIDGHDREQSVVTDDFHLNDDRFGGKLWAAYTLPGDRVRLSVALERRYRAGSGAGVSRAETDTGVFGSLLVRY